MSYPLRQYPEALVCAKTVDDVAAFVSGGGDPESVQWFADDPTMRSTEAAAPVKSWLRQQDERRAQEKLKLDQRNVGAAERSALAAEMSAKYARHSAWAAAIAVGISIVALIVAVVDAVDK